MYEARQNKEKVSRQINGGSIVRQRVKIEDGRNRYTIQFKKVHPLGNIVQLQPATVNYEGIKGESNKDEETKTNMEKWPYINSKFDALVLNQTIKGKERSKYHCAEPNAFSRYLTNCKEVKRDDLATGRFTMTTQGRLVREPCEVCSQWIEPDGSSYKIKNGFVDNLFPSNISSIKKGEEVPKSISLSLNDFPTFPVPADL